jgi:hypothetical protein
MSTATRRSRRDILREAVDRRLRTQLRIFLVVFAVTVIVTIERVVAWRVNPLWALAGFAVGLAIGVALARSKPLTWDATARRVVAGNTVLGVVLIGLYLVFALEKSDILGRWISDAQIVGVVAVAITSGVMWGRLLTTFRGIRGVLGTADVPLPGSEPTAP